MSLTDLPQPNEIPSREKEQAMAAWLTMFATTAVGLPLPFLNFLAALIYHQYTKRTSPFVSFHSYQSLILQFIVSIMNGIAVAWAIYCLFHSSFTNLFYTYLIFIGVINLLYFIFSIIAAVKAYQGKMFYFLFFGKVAFRNGYRSYDEPEKTTVNRAPF